MRCKEPGAAGLGQSRRVLPPGSCAQSGHPWDSAPTPGFCARRAGIRGAQCHPHAPVHGGQASVGLSAIPRLLCMKGGHPWGSALSPGFSCARRVGVCGAQCHPQAPVHGGQVALPCSCWGQGGIWAEEPFFSVLLWFAFGFSPPGTPTTPGLWAPLQHSLCKYVTTLLLRIIQASRMANWCPNKHPQQLNGRRW